METVCRLCSRQSRSLESIFSFKNGRLISDLINSLIPIVININDNFPKKVCSKCLSIIEKAQELRENSVKTDESFRTGTFQILPEIEEEPAAKTDSEKLPEKRKSTDAAGARTSRKRCKTSAENDDDCPYGCNKAPLDTEKLEKIEEKLDKLVENLCDLDKLASKMMNLEKKVMNQEHDLKSNKTFITNCLENAIGSKPQAFPTKLCATTVAELDSIDRSLMVQQNTEYFIKYLNNNIGKSPDFKSYMKRALEIVMASELKGTLSFANHIRNLHSYLIISDCCSTKFDVSKKEIETYVSRNIANLKNYNKCGKFRRQGVAEGSSSSSFLRNYSEDSQTEIKTEDCYFEVRELN